MNVILGALASALVFVLCYLAGAFFAWNINAGEWGDHLRFAVLMFGVPLSVLAFACILARDAA